MDQRIKSAVHALIAKAMEEDQCHQDVTTLALIPPRMKAAAVVVAKEDGIICGTEIVKEVFHKLDPRIKVVFFVRDGQKVKKGQKVIRIQGKARAMLSGERMALNFLSHLSGIATRTQEFVSRIRPYKSKILDTRKTLPGWRALQKMAVKCGGGENHRFDLSQMVMIKDNHRQLLTQQGLSLAGSISELRKKTSMAIEVEMDDLQQFKSVLQARPDVILLDNMSLSQLKQAVKIKRLFNSRVFLEASGGITLQNVRAVAQTGVDRISIGALTHSVRAMDFSMEFEPV